jgi:hypothetical protein
MQQDSVWSSWRRSQQLASKGRGVAVRTPMSFPRLHQGRHGKPTPADPLYPPLVTSLTGQPRLITIIQSTSPFVFHPSSVGARSKQAQGASTTSYPPALASAVLAWCAIATHVCCKPLQRVERAYRFGCQLVLYFFILFISACTYLFIYCLTYFISEIEMVLKNMQP